jgi:hypothetical protein
MISKLSRSCLIALVLIAAALTGCAYQPAFTESLPEKIDTEGRSLAVIGDLQQTPGFVRFMRQREDTSESQDRLIADLTQRIDDLSALVVVGDLVYTARSGRDWDHFDDLVAPFVARMPVLPAIGNHDYPCIFIQLCWQKKIIRGMIQRFPWFAPGQPYAVEGDGLLMLFLDSETALEAQAAWLEEQLAAAAGRYSAALVFYHRPAYTNTIDWGAYPNEEVQRYIVPKLEQADLPVVVFNGHVHGYEYIVRNNVHYVTTAGGGGPRGPMGDERPDDYYRGPDCPQPDSDEIFRPFNYALITPETDRLTIDIHGFCRADPEIALLDSIEVPLR